tara:strand:+ start:453 stop:704 length:252 start_codon:yes stop_codon:yes gene_type:complete
MCGVVGFSCEEPDEDKIKLLQEIVYQSKIRGLHSFGYSYIDNGLQTKKRHDLKNVNLPFSSKIIFHNRYATSGDYKDHKTISQ